MKILNVIIKVNVYVQTYYSNALTTFSSIEALQLYNITLWSEKSERHICRFMENLKANVELVWSNRIKAVRSEEWKLCTSL